MSRADWSFPIDGRQTSESGLLGASTNAGWVGSMVGLAYEDHIGPRDASSGRH